MFRRLGQDFRWWPAIFLLVALGLCFTNYRSHSNDSNFYNFLVDQVAEKSPSGWLTPVWKGKYGRGENQLIRDHFLGHVIQGVVLTRLGIPSKHALHLISLFYQLLTVILLFFLIARFIGPKKSSAVLWLLFLIPISMSYGIRANHEQGLTFYSVLALWGVVLLSEGRSVLGAGLIAIGINAVCLIKGLAFLFLLPVCVFSLWVCYEGKLKSLVATPGSLGIFFLALVSPALTIYSYDRIYLQLTGVPFWERYWELQIMGRSIESVQSNNWLLSKIKNLGYYLSRGLYYTAPWSYISVIIVLIKRKSIRWVGLEDKRSQILWLLFGSGLLYILGFSLSNRIASRYIFPTFLLWSAGFAIWLPGHFPWFAQIKNRIDRWGAARTGIVIWLFLLVSDYIAWWIKES